MLVENLKGMPGFILVWAFIAAGSLIAGCAPDTDTLDEIKAFSQRTEQLLEQDRALTEEYSAHMAELTRTLEETGSAKAAVESGVYSRLANNMDKALALGTQYQQELEVLFGKLDEESPCYFPEIAANLKGVIAEKQRVANTLREFQSAGLEEGGAVLAGLSGSTASFAAGMSNLTEMFKICMVPAAMGLTKSEMEARSERAADEEISDDDRFERGAEPLEVEEYTRKRSVLPMRPLWLGRQLPIDVRDPSDIKNVEFSDGVTVDENFELVLPEPFRSDSSKLFSFRITGTVADEYNKYILDVEVSRVGYTPMASLRVNNAALANCIDTIVAKEGFQFMEEFTEISCLAQENSQISLDELFQFKNLDEATLTNFDIEGIAKTSLPEKLSALMFYRSKLDGLPRFTNTSARMELWDSEVKDWSGIAQMSIEHLMVDTETADCDLVRSWDQDRSDLVIVHDGLSVEEKMARRIRIQDDDAVTGVLSRCTL
ncbi:hypothetical protein [uncultured Microbulbifer sp.]|uniref:hypothetical protein n=1 Tax=uncultured Microbulbifer sp. TaxID=348147 RepID=UPI00262566A8|nr:hypothetical protein [uncultured Microbulbifer sp.]